MAGAIRTLISSTRWCSSNCAFESPAGVNTDRRDLVVDGQSIEGCGQIHVVGADDEVRDAVVPEALQVRGGSTFAAQDEDVPPE